MFSNKLALFSLIMLLSSFFTACKNLKKMLPEGAAIKEKERTALLQNRPPHQVQYTSQPMVNFPVNPIQVWAAAYELDLILVSKHPKWNMHEYAKLLTPNGDLWIMKDAEEGSLDQYITADIPDIEHWMPELPVTRKYYPVKVVNKSTNKFLDFEFEYENIKGELVQAHYKGKYPKTALKKRNGSTMGHSRNQLLVALDLPYRNFGKKARISYANEPYKMEKLLGIVPFQMALQQTQGGLSTGHYTLQGRPNSQQLRSTHYNQNTSVEQEWSYTQTEQTTTLQQQSDFRTLQYEFLGGTTQELQTAFVQQWNEKEQGVRITFSPPLPDIRRKFTGQYHSDFIIDMNGQESNAVGKVVVEWLEEQVSIKIIPTAPWWMEDRAMETLIDYDNEVATAKITMLPATVTKNR